MKKYILLVTTWGLILGCSSTVGSKKIKNRKMASMNIGSSSQKKYEFTQKDCPNIRGTYQNPFGERKDSEDAMMELKKQNDRLVLSIKDNMHLSFIVDGKEHGFWDNKRDKYLAFCRGGELHLALFDESSKGDTFNYIIFTTDYLGDIEAISSKKSRSGELTLNTKKYIKRK